jgi:L-fucose isomerase-like protein
LRRWAKEQALDAFAIQCWTSIQNNYGVCSCTTMSRLGDARMPAACESDILGTLSMHASMLAADQPAALADWNNLHDADDELVNVWHCGVFPKSFAKTQPKLNVHGMMVDSGSVQAKDADGIVSFVVRESPLTLTRITQSADGEWKAALAEGRVEDNDAATNGSYGWCRISKLQSFYRDGSCATSHITSPSLRPMWATCCGRHSATTSVSRCITPARSSPAATNRRCRSRRRARASRRARGARWLRRARRR